MLLEENGYWTNKGNVDAHHNLQVMDWSLQVYQCYCETSKFQELC